MMTIEVKNLHRDDGAGVAMILNDAILHTTAIYDDQPRSVEAVEAWIDAQIAASRPVLGVFEGDRLIGYGSYGTFRALPGYRTTVEHSIYVSNDRRQGGVGRALLNALVNRAIDQGLHAMVGVIDAGNLASRRLHETAGFDLVGTMPQVAVKFGRWLDVCLYQRVLPTSLPADLLAASPHQ